nr:zinc finger BED domain-containing protein 1-like [Onthophagus taurus]
MFVNSTHVKKTSIGANHSTGLTNTTAASSHSINRRSTKININYTKRTYKCTGSSGTSGQITNYLFRPLTMKKQKEIDRQLIAIITKEYHPFSIVEDDEFKKLIYMLNSNYKLPTRKTVSQSLIPNLYQETVDIVQGRLKRATAICLTVDGWSSRNQDSFYSVTAHYVVEEEKRTYLASDLLGCVSFADKHTGENIANKLKIILNEWEISEKINLAIRIGGWKHWGCFAHSLNLVVQSGLKEVRVIVDKLKKIVRYFKKSTHAYSKLRETQERMELPALKLKNDVPTRWNSTYEMMQRIITLKTALVSALAVIKSGRDVDINNIDLLSNEEWLIAEQTVNILEMFNVVTTAVSAEKEVSASCIILYYKQLMKHINSFNTADLMPEVNQMAEKLKLELHNRFSDMEDNELISQATVLDPRFKKFGFITQTSYSDAIEKICSENTSTNTMIYYIENTASYNHTSTLPESNKSCLDILWKDFDLEVQNHLTPQDTSDIVKKEMDKYLEEPLLARKDIYGVIQDPLVWWHQRKHIYPNLFQIMKKRMCVMATSVPCERIFSKAGQIVSEKRERLTTNKIAQVVFLSYNLNNRD